MKQVKRILTAIVGVVVLSLGLNGGAMAADLGGQTFKPAAPIAASEWGGLYVGGHVGYGWADRDGFTCWDGPFSPAPLPEYCSDGFEFNYEQDGWLAGAELGYRMQRGKFVAGLAVDASLADLEGNIGRVSDGEESEQCDGSPICAGQGNWDWMSTAMLQGGFAPGQGRFLIYGEVGLGLAGFDWDGLSGCTFEQVRSGLAYGGGVAVKVSDRASLNLEYNRLDFSDDDAQSCVATAFLTPTYIEVHDPDIDVVKFGFNYILQKE